VQNKTYFSEGKETTRCDKVCSFYCLNKFWAPICPKHVEAIKTTYFVASSRFFIFTVCTMHCHLNIKYALTCSIRLFNVLAPTCFGSSLPSSGSFLDPPELLEIQIEWVVYHTMCDYVTCVLECRGTLYDIPPILLVFQVT
jgi:hypothetical protein